MDQPEAKGPITMQKKMRRSDRAVAESEAKEILSRGEYGVLSTVSADGQPYGVPVSYSYAGDAIYFHCAVEGHKLDNIQANPRVSFCVVGRTEVIPADFGTHYESVIVFGSAAEVTGAEKVEGLLELVKKYSPDYIPAGLQEIEKSGAKAKVYKITVETITGKAKK
jgi:uncharacterized protein